jgi:carbamoyltransferase
VKVLGLMSSHDCSFSVLDNGVPRVHAELERYIREKEPEGDPFEFFKKVCGEQEHIDDIAVCYGFSEHMKKNYPDGLRKFTSYIKENDIKLHAIGHHQSHAANAFYSSNLDEALIVTLDGGGMDLNFDNKLIPTSYTVWEGAGTKIEPRAIVHSEHINIGFAWQRVTKLVFGLSSGHPRGNQAGTVMAMACMGDPDKYLPYFEKYNFILQAYHVDEPESDEQLFDFVKMREIASRSEKDAFDVAAALQKATENKIKEIFDLISSQTEKRNLCLSGGVILNSVVAGKLHEWYSDRYDNIYVCPVAYDAGIAIGAAQYVWHYIKGNDRIKWEDNASPYLGEVYDSESINHALENDKLTYKVTNQYEVLQLLSDQNIVSVFSGGSESGRRALGNRSILADPRNPNMKNLINEKVKHRQWFRPFAPSILRERVADWFTIDIDSPYMSFVINFKDEVKHKVPAVVHIDGTGRLQTVTEKDNKWYYSFLKKWEKMTGIPILLNTSFNDREPIVETPEHAVNCFLGTNIDYLYFVDEEILVSKKKESK